jgi:two-component system sensor histidine kinase VicK
LGFKRREIIGKWFPDTVIAEDESGRVLPLIERPIAEVFLTGQPIFRKLYYRKTDGSRVAVAQTVSPLLLEGKPIGAIMVFRDITEEIALENAKNEFIALASHQLRTPATGVKQYIGMLLEGYAGKLTQAQEQFLNTANESNDRQLRIIDDLLKVAALQSGTIVANKQKTDLVALTKSVIAEQATKFKSSRQQLLFEHESPKLHAEVDNALFRMVLENLIDNAHKYTYEGKKILVKIRNRANKIEITVKDEGTGINEADIDKLFQKFSRIDNPLSISAGGNGLGLYWVQQIIDLHSGTITVTSKLGIGTTFTITI